MASGFAVGRFGSPVSAPGVANRGATPIADGGPLSFENPKVRSFLGQPGPWGRLRYTRITIEPPDSFFRGHTDFQKETRWFFPGKSAAEADAFVGTLGLPEEQRQALARAPHQAGGEGTWVTPDEGLVLALDPAARTHLYTALAASPQNQQRSPIWVHEPLIGERVANSDLPPAITDLFKKLLYGEGRWRLFADLPLLAARLTTTADEENLAGMLSRSTTFVANLQIDDHSDIQALASYWSRGYRRRDVEPIIASLKRNPGGYELDISHLLPAFARQRLYTYEEMAPQRPDPGHDCFWSSANFFNDPPPDRSFGNDEFRELLEARYRPVDSSELQLGDVIAYFDDRGTPVHAANYVADQVVFTKNGRNALHPFMFMRIDSLLDLYRAAFAGHSSLTARYFRLKDGP